MDIASIKQAILKVNDLTESDMDFLLTCVTCRSLKKGETLLSEGDHCRAFFYVKKGYLRTWYNKDGVPINLHFTLEEGFITDMKTLKSRQPTKLTIEAGEDAVVWVFDMTKIREFKGYLPISSFIRRVAVAQLLESVIHSDMCKV